MKDACQSIYDEYINNYNLGDLIDRMLALNN